MKMYKTVARIRFITEAKSALEAEKRLEEVMVALNRLLSKTEVMTFTDTENPDIYTEKLELS